MLKYAKIVDPEKGICEVGIGTDEEFYKSIGMELMDVEESEDGTWYLVGFMPPPVITIADYDNAMEKYLYDTRCARGYTTREPSDYKDSNIERWKQDAIDYINFRDAVMLYGLEVQNKFAETGIAPTIDEFLNNMPKITWAYEDGVVVL